MKNSRFRAQIVDFQRLYIDKNVGKLAQNPRKMTIYRHFLADFEQIWLKIATNREISKDFSLMVVQQKISQISLKIGQIITNFHKITVFYYRNTL